MGGPPDAGQQLGSYLRAVYGVEALHAPAAEPVAVAVLRPVEQHTRIKQVALCGDGVKISMLDRHGKAAQELGDPLVVEAPDETVLDLGGNLVPAALVHAGVQVDAHARLLCDRTFVEIDVERARRRRRHVEKLDAVGALVRESATRGAHRVVKLVPLLALKKLRTRKAGVGGCAQTNGNGVVGASGRQFTCPVKGCLPHA